MRSIDFLVIGAPKAGTTSLFEYLREHPDIYMPAWKETTFFLDPLYARGVDWYRRWVLSDASTEAVSGEASVRYMAGTPYYVSADQGEVVVPSGPGLPPSVEAEVPARIAQDFPNMKLIALLRDPVDRAISEYKMAVLNGFERRSPKAAFEHLLNPEQLTYARVAFHHDNCYVVHGEYGRILAPYVEQFGSDNLLTLFTTDLSASPGRVVRTVFEFLGVNPDYVPKNLDRRYLEGSTTPKIKALHVRGATKSLRRVGVARNLWRAVPEPTRRRAWTFIFRIEQWNRKSEPPGGGASPSEIDPALKTALREHYESDTRKLAELLGRPLPWQRLCLADVG